MLLNELFGFQLKSLLPKTDGKRSEWYAHYELLATDYLTNAPDLSTIKRSLLWKGGIFQLKRKEIADLQLRLGKLG